MMSSGTFMYSATSKFTVVSRQGGVEGFSLRLGARKSVEDETMQSIRLPEPRQDEFDGEFVRNVVPSIHVTANLTRQCRVLLPNIAKDVSTRDVRKVKDRFEALCLGALPCSWRAKHN